MMKPLDLMLMIVFGKNIVQLTQSQRQQVFVVVRTLSRACRYQIQYLIWPYLRGITAAPSRFSFIFQLLGFYSVDIFKLINAYTSLLNIYLIHTPLIRVLFLVLFIQNYFNLSEIKT